MKSLTVKINMFNKENNSIPSWLLNTAIIFFIIILVIVLGFWFWEKNYEGKIYPGVHVGKIELGGKTAKQAEQLLGQQIDYLYQNGLDFNYEEYRTSILPTVASPDAELAYNIIDFDSSQTVQTAMNYGRDGIFLTNLKNQFASLLIGHAIQLDYAIDEEGFKKTLAKNFSRFETPAKDADLSYDVKTGTFNINPEKIGRTIDYQQAIDRLKTDLASLEFSTINLESSIQKPSVTIDNSTNSKNTADRYLALAPVTLKSGENSWTIEKNQLGNWLGLKLDAYNQTSVGLNEENVKTYLQTTVSPKLEKKPTESRFTIKNGKVTEFQTGQEGVSIDYEESIKNIENSLVSNQNKEIELVINKVTGQSATSSTENLGITEIIGTGHSNFKGSPKNRRFNIKFGADLLNGLLIKPGDTFSVMKSLGKIDDKSGFLPELVIKGNKTTPEFGGGLCQIGTTVFRAALASGLPITERHSHSYRVSYYEPAGTDATLYDPSPDLKFNNDTGNYVLIQSRIQDNDLYFDFWGTKDGRIATQTPPVIYNIVKPKPTKIIESTSLPVGQKKCTEKAHNGADAYFNYSVLYADGAKKEKRFSSHYVPWQEVCLIGVDKLTASSTAMSTTTKATATSTTSKTSATSTKE